MWDIQGKNLMYCDLVGSILYRECQSVIKTVCFQSGHVYVGTCKNVGCPLVILVDVRLEVRCQRCVGASSVDPQQVRHGVTVCLKWQH